MTRTKKFHYPTKTEYYTLLEQYNEFDSNLDYVSSRVFDLKITIMKLSKRLDEVERVKNYAVRT